MAQQVDSRVVQMTFDNSQFEKNAGQSLNTLNKLNSNVNSIGQTQAFSNLNQSINNVDLSGLNSGMASLQSRFSALGVAGMTVVQNLTNTAMDYAKKGVSFVTSTIKNAGRSRAENIEQAKFQLKGLGVAWNDVKGDIEYGVQDTAYGLDVAAKAAAQLSASGIKMGTDMKASLRGISGVAAMTNSSYEDISNIFTTVAGNGRLMGEQLNQISSRGLNAASTLAKYLNTHEKVRKSVMKTGLASKTGASYVREFANANKLTEANVRSLVSSGAIDYKTFATAMDSAFGPQAKKANELYSGSLANLKSALGRIGAEPWSAKLEGMTNVFNALREAVNEVHRVLGSFDIDTKTGTGLIGMFSLGILKATDGMVKFINQITKYLKTVNVKEQNKDMKNLQNIVKGVSSVFKVLLKILVTIGKAVGPFLSGIVSIAGAFGEFIFNINSAILSSKGFEKICSGIIKISTIMGKGIEKVGEGISFIFDKITTAAGNFFDKLSTIFTGTNSLLSLMNASGLVLILTNVTKIAHSLSGPSEIFQNFIYSLSTTGRSYFYMIKRIPEVMDELRRCLIVWQADISANILMKTAAAIAILAASAALLASIDPKRLASATAAIAALGIVLAATFKIMVGGFDADNASKGVKGLLGSFMSAMGATYGLIQFSIAIIAFASALLIMSAAVKNLSKLKLSEIAKGLIGIGGALVIMSAALGVMSSVEGPVMKMAASLVIFSVAMNLMASAVIKLGSIKASGIAKGLAGIAIILASIIMFIDNIDDTQGAIKAAASMILIATSMKIMAKAIKTLSSLSWEGLAKGLVTVTALLLVMSKTIDKLSFSNAISVAIALVIFSKAIDLLTDSVIKMENVKWEGIQKGLVTIASLITSLLILNGFISEDIIKIAVALLIVSEALKTLTVSVTKIASLSLDQLQVGLGGLALALLILAGGLRALSESSVAKGSLALFVAAGALMAITPVLMALGNMKVENIVKGLAAMAAVFAILGAAGMLLSGVIVPILGLSVAVSLLGAAMLAAGAGMALFTTSIAGLISMGAAGITAMKDTLITFAQTLPAIFTGLANGFVSFMSTLAANMPQVMESIKTIVLNLISTIAELAPKIFALLVTMLDQFLATLATKIPSIVDSGAKIVVALLEGIARNMPKVVKAGVDIVVSFIRSIGMQLPRIVDAGYKMIIDLINGMADAINNNTEPLVDAMFRLMLAMLKAALAFPAKFFKVGFEAIKEIIKGAKDEGQELVDEAYDIAKNFIKGFVNGILDFIGSAVDKIKSFGSKVVTALRDKLGIESPSKVTYQIGKYTVEGYTNALDDYSSKAYNAASDLGAMAQSGLTDALSDLSNIISGDIDSNPVITPVLDLSSVKSEASNLSNILAINDALNLNAKTTAGVITTKIQNESTTADVVSALNSLKNAIANTNGGNTYVVDGVTYDDGSNITDAVKTLVNATVVEKRL